MQFTKSLRMPRLLVLLAGLLIFKVTISVILGYRDYFPPNFDSDFLLGRESYFFGSYQWAFYTHIVSSPIALLLGVILISERFRLRFPVWHRYLGRIQGVCTLLLVTPSGIWMSYHAATGAVAAMGFCALGLATATCVALGWRSAVHRRFAEHRRWMWRSFLLLCSAVVIRVVGGVTVVAAIDAEWPYPLAAWMSWLAPLAVLELTGINLKRKPGQVRLFPNPASDTKSLEQAHCPRSK
jgi:hypothetical protein